MKKRYFIPSLLLLASTSLTACSGEGGGLITNGQKYRAGDAQNVDPSLRLQKEDTIKTVTEKMNMSASIKISTRGSSLSISEKLSGTVVVDLVNHKISGNYTISASATGSGSQSMKISFKATEENGYISIYEGENYSSANIDSDTLSTMYQEASYTVYSWNYEPSEGQIGQLVDTLGSLTEIADADDIMREVERMYSSFYFTGNLETGTFDVGLAEGFTLNIIPNMPITFNKMKASYKDCLIQSSIVGLTMKGKEGDVSYNISETLKVTYSYNSSSSSSQSGPTNPFGL